MFKNVTKILLSTTVGILLFSHGAHAFDKESYKKIASTVIQDISAGKVDVDSLISMQSQLVDMGKKGCSELATKDAKHAPFLKLVASSADAMKSMSLDDIEENWHDGGAFEKAGLDIESIDHFGAVNGLLDSVIHPATAYIALNEYKTSKDEDLLEQVKDELKEVLEHLEHVH